jgi:predicted AAA+ superfamily ATPase
VEEKDRKILLLFRQYLSAGYYPFCLEMKDIGLYHVLVEQTMRASIENDLPAVHEALTGASVKKMRKLLSILAVSVPFTPDLNKLKKALDIGDERTLKTYLGYLEDAGVVSMVGKVGGKLRSLAKPEKIYLNNPNQLAAVVGGANSDKGTLRETFFVSMASPFHDVKIPDHGDFLIDNKVIVEVGGRNKDFTAAHGEPVFYVAADDIERGVGRRIPLWLFGFLY